ncbi:MAG TPA: hypothetical protein VMW75_21165 [Thermoanaerobaculia bacterium]|nr:hypothetical protein [Thermoanaerobaculia bacterium]
MVPVLSLWWPIVLAAVFVFLASTIIHMLLRYHANDMRQLPREDEAMAALRPLEIPPGDYFMPRAGSMAAMKDPAFVEKMKAGPVAIMTVLPNGPSAMGGTFVLWFLYTVVVGGVVAYVTGHALGIGATYRTVFKLAGATAFAGYALALPPFSIWYKRSWVTTFKGMFDGLIYALLTAGTFGWLWPR